MEIVEEYWLNAELRRSFDFDFESRNFEGFWANFDFDFEFENFNFVSALIEWENRQLMI